MWNKFLRNPLHIVKDYELRKLLWQSGGGTAVCKKYLKFRDIAPEKLTFPETQVDEPIWLFWNTGLEQAPEIVKTCYQSIKKYAGRQVVLLTENNVQNYINMPDYLNEKLKSGVLPLAIYADLMRVALLEHYGGTWMDATILLTDKIPQEILNSDFLCFTIHSVKLIIPYCIRSGSSTPSNIIERFLRFVMSYLLTGNEIIMYQNICFPIL